MGRPGVRWPDLGCPPDPALSPPVHRSRPRQPWSAEEHSRFLDALDRADAGDSAGVWRSIAHRVGARPVHEVKLHAHKYFLRLHAAGAAKAAAPPDASLRRPWTHREDAAFEDAVAEVGEDAPDRWDRVAACVPGRSAEEARARYEELLVDVARIEVGEMPVAAQAAAEKAGERRRGGALLDTGAPPGPGASPSAQAAIGSMLAQSGAAAAPFALYGASTPVAATAGSFGHALGPGDDRLRLTLARDAYADTIFSPSRLFQGAGAWQGGDGGDGGLLSPQRSLGYEPGFSFPPTPLGPHATGSGGSSGGGGGGTGSLSDGLPALDDLIVTGTAITLRKWPADADEAARAGVGGEGGGAGSEEGPPALKRQRLSATHV